MSEVTAKIRVECNGKVLEFDAALLSEFSFRTPVREVSCEEYGCNGCLSVHWKHTGEAILRLESRMPRSEMPSWCDVA